MISGAIEEYIYEYPLPYCASRFLRQWERHEEELYRNLSMCPTTDHIHRALKYFQVARTFKDLPINGNLKKIRRALIDAIDVKEEQYLLSETVYVDQVDKLAKSFKRDFIKYNLSAASKLLWLSMRGNVIIYDSRALRALSRLHGESYRTNDYRSYCLAWRTVYNSIEPLINEAIIKLPEGAHFMPKTRFSDTELKCFSGEAWFKERVFDILLWEIGAPLS